MRFALEPLYFLFPSKQLSWKMWDIHGTINCESVLKPEIPRNCPCCFCFQPNTMKLLGILLSDCFTSPRPKKASFSSSMVTVEPHLMLTNNIQIKGIFCSLMSATKCDIFFAFYYFHSIFFTVLYLSRAREWIRILVHQQQVRVIEILDTTILWHLLDIDKRGIFC